MTTNASMTKQSARDILISQRSQNPHFRRIRTSLLDSEPGEQGSERHFAWMTCVLALQAVKRGNFGIGSVLVDHEARILESGHNQVFAPRFTSDGHAEMVVMSRFEARQRRKLDLSRCTLYTSLESCPMCLCRLITSGVGTVLYVAADNIGGMVRCKEALPPVWRDLAKAQKHRQAHCPRPLQQAASDIFMLNAQQLNQGLV